MKLKNSNQAGNISPVQQLLIKACLASSKETREHALREWESLVVINDLDFSSSRLIPFLIHGNQRLGMTTKHDSRLKIIYKHWWLRTQHISHELKKIHDALLEAGIEVAIIKGASIKTHYELDVLRPMSDFDLLVRPEDFKMALSFAQELGYTPNERQIALWKKYPGLVMENDHAISCTHYKNGTQIDIHWRVGSHCSTEFTNLLWFHLEDYKAMPLARRPSLAYEVFMLMIHAADSANRDNLNWLIDIEVINKKARHAFWVDARAIAVKEKKEDLFDCACLILIQFGIYAPNPAKINKPKFLIYTTPKQRVQMSITHLFFTKLHNLRLSIDRLFPYSNAFSKMYHGLRRILFYFIIVSMNSSKQ